MHTTLVSTETLAAHVTDRVTGRSTGHLTGDRASGLAIVDCRFDLQNEEQGREAYHAAHIPGAVYASLARDLSGEKTGRNGRHPLPSIGQMTAVFGRLGIDRTTQVVAYDQDSGMFASRLWWMLRYLGHDAVAVLDGGFAKWQREQRPIASGDQSRPSVEFVGAPRPDLRVDLPEVTALASTHDSRTLLLDARGPDRFEGQSEPLDRVAGHIPGADNHYYKLNLTDEGTLLPAAALRERLTARLGQFTPAQTVMYCGSGVSACLNLLAMEHAGLPGAKLFAGSWSEWSADPARPVETGASRRRASSDESRPAGG
jgi:thiosulfate/3-mercaptopyruvate sulfurtransferase